MLLGCRSMFSSFSPLMRRSLRVSAQNYRRSSAVPHSNCSVCLPPTTSFSAKPIGTLDALARMLQHSVQELQYIATTADQRYRVIRIPKDGGGFRECFDALGPLKSIYGRLLHMILEAVNYPLYLQGSIKDRSSPRGQKANAEQHINPQTLI